MARVRIKVATVYAAVLPLAVLPLFSCLTAELEKQAEILKEQEAEIARQRKEIEALKSSQQAQDKRLRDCNRAFREFFERAQITADSDRAICPDDDVAHYELGRLLAAQGRNPEAEKEFEAALKINPEFTDARARLDALRKDR
jgi:tetratricopeptide (TPR) repeat protein